MSWLIPAHKVPDATKAEISTSWALFILIMLLISALFGSYLLQTRKVQAVHETVMSIFAGTLVALGRHWTLCVESCQVESVPSASKQELRMRIIPQILQSGGGSGAFGA